MNQRPALKELQAMPLSAKVAYSFNVISQALAHFDDKMYVSFSGGKDSTVLLDLVRKIKPDIKAVFCDTGLEYPEIKKFVRTVSNVEIIRPAMPFHKVIEKYGYPVISKEQAYFIYQYRNTKSEKLRQLRLTGNGVGIGKIYKKWLFMIDAPFKISGTCCDVMKKRPFYKYEKNTGLKPFVGTMATDSLVRLRQWERYTCNAFEKNHPTSNPLSIWMENDIWEYIHKFNIPYCPVYDIEGIDRTGCMFCMFGVHLDKINRFDLMAKTHPKQYNYCMNNLGCGKVLEYMLQTDVQQLKLDL